MMSATEWQYASLAMGVGYLLGSIPSAIWVCRFFFKIDITQVGSKNPGMTNVWRTLGWKPALPVAILDAAKGTLAAGLAGQLTGNPWWALAAGVAAVVGHSYSFLAHFKGGKSVLTAFGVFLYLSPLASLTSLGLWLLSLSGTRMVSLSSLVAALALPISVYWESRWHETGGTTSAFWAALIISAFVIVRHRANILRLLQGTEPRFKGRST